MKLEVGKFNDAKIQSTGGKTIKMGFSTKANAMLFDMFTDTIYSNPIASIVREITSNCFDSHIEAGKNTPDNPVIVSHTYDQLTNEHYLSFFDNGVGMSPERIENIYGKYFESTKRDSNDEIGGFGIGGKSPMAYKRIIEINELQPDGTYKNKIIEDSSFSVITRYNGIEYTYCIIKGSQSPEINLTYETSTTKCNGTEVRVPIKSSDLSRFVSEIKKQLYYFENIVFTGFDGYENLNDYKIYKGKNFLYRGNVYGDEVHLCIGKVAYPIRYTDMNLNRYDYRVPIGLKFDIGDIDVTPNREDVRYTPKTIEKITEKMEAARKELVEMISKQYENVQTLADYYMAKERFGHLTFKDQNSLYVGSWIKKSDVIYDNFKFKALPFIPSSDVIIKQFYNVHEYGKQRNKRIEPVFGKTNHRIYQCKGEFQRKVIKQSYLASLHDKRFLMLKPIVDLFEDDKLESKLRLAFGVTKEDYIPNVGHMFTDVLPKATAIKLLKELQKEVVQWVSSNFTSYDELEVPQDFIDDRKRNRLSNEILNTTIPLGDAARYNTKERISIKSLVEFKGRIFYGNSDESHLVKEGYQLYKSLFGDNHIDSFNWDNKFNRGKGIMFVTVSKANEKYLKMCPNAYRVELIYPILLRRKFVNPLNVLVANNYISKHDGLEGVFANESFGIINKVAADYYKEVKKEIEDLKVFEKYEHVNFNSELISKYVDVSKITNATLIIKTERQLNYLLEVQNRNKEVIKWIDFPVSNMKYLDLNRDCYIGLVEVLKKVMVF